MTVQDKYAILKLNEGGESIAAQSVFDYSTFRIDHLAIQAMDAFGFLFQLHWVNRTLKQSSI